MTEQEVVALTLVGFAVAFLTRRAVARFAPRARGPEPLLSSRLARGLAQARRSRQKGSKRSPDDPPAPGREGPR